MLLHCSKKDGLPVSDDDEPVLARSATEQRKSRIELQQMMEDHGRDEEATSPAPLGRKDSVAGDITTTTVEELKALATSSAPVATVEEDDEDEEEEEEEEDEVVTGFGAEKAMTMAEFSVAAYNKLPQNLATEKDLPPNVSKLNRYFNILPNPVTRVKLTQVPGTDATTMYVNANYITNYDGTRNKQYIASQGPMPNARSVADFWRMVWETDCRAILMVTGITEKGVEKCARYWPLVLYNAEDGVGDQTFGGYNVRVTNGFRKDGYITSQLTVCKKGEAPRDVYHYWFDSWPDHGVPSRAEPVIGMIEAVRKQDLSPTQPILVHCSAGIGRTGTVIGIDHGMQQLRTKGAADTMKIISNLRRCRGGMVQHPEQAEFVNMVLARFADANASVATLSVIEESMQRALQAVPKGFTVHASQVDVDEGGNTSVPSWRQQQLEDKKQMEADDLAEELDELRQHRPQIADRKEARAKAKADAKAKAGGEIMSLLAAGKSIKLPSGSKANMGGKSMKMRANAHNPKESANVSHGSIKFGKITARSYATLDGDFHLDSISEYAD
jgi:receptor-type tyrosine-protein phosphatase R